MANEYRIHSISAEILLNGTANAQIYSESAEVMLNGVADARVYAIGVEVMESLAVATSSRRRNNFMNWTP